jgi:hypothetical protein
MASNYIWDELGQKRRLLLYTPMVYNQLLARKNHVRQSHYMDHRLLHTIKKDKNNKTINIHKKVYTQSLLIKN